MTKKKKPTTLIFTVLVAGFAAFTFFDYSRNKGKETLSEYEMKLVDLPEMEITSVLMLSPQETLELKKEKDEWKILKPLVDDVDEMAMTGFLQGLINAKIQKVSDEVKATIDWKKYGLEPGIKFEVGSAKKTNEFVVSSSNAFDGSFYLRVKDQLYLGDRSWAHIADKSAVQLRSRTIWRTSGAVKKLALRIDEPRKMVENTVLSKSEKGWESQPALDLPVSQDRVRDWLEAVQDLRATGIAMDNPVRADLEKLQLTKPSLVAQFTITKDGKEDSVTWEIGQDLGEDVYLKTSERATIYKLSKGGIKDIRISLNKFLDGKKAFRFNLEEAKDLLLVRDGSAFHFVKNEKAWILESPKGDTFKPEGLVEFLQKLEALDPIVEDLPPDLQFHANMNRLVVKSEQKTLLEIVWTPEKNHLRWLKNPAVSERFKVSADKMNALLGSTFTMTAKPKDDAKGEAKK
jgi:hypothetical protein